ncbi:MAG: signal peptidase I [Acutalibacteraceae bacterium]|jgi:signal peptidase I
MTALSSPSRTKPTARQLREELERLRHRRRIRQTWRGVLGTMIVVAACAVLISVIWLPVLRIVGFSMSPTLEEGEIVVAARNVRIKSGDVAAFYIGNKLLVKRCVAGPGSVVDIDESGRVYVDGALLEEPYLTEFSRGYVDVSLPCTVPDGRWFFLGDSRAVSADSRSSAIGCVAEEQIMGKIVWRVWPPKDMGPVE